MIFLFQQLHIFFLLLLSRSCIYLAAGYLLNLHQNLLLNELQKDYKKIGGYTNF